MKTVDIPEGKWKVILNGETISEKGLMDFKGKQYIVPALSAVILAE